MPLSIGVLKETSAHEARVALTPDVAAKFLELGVDAPHGARRGRAQPPRRPALQAACSFTPTRAATCSRASSVLLKVQPPTLAEVDALQPGAVVVGFMQPHRELELVRRLRDRKITSFAVELIPRISRAQSMDALSSQAAAAGYKAALLAANALDKFLPMLTTAAGTIRPAQVLVIGAGVAGLAGDRDGAPARRDRRSATTCAPRRRSRSSRSARSSSTPASPPKAPAAMRASSRRRRRPSSRRSSISTSRRPTP